MMSAYMLYYDYIFNSYYNVCNVLFCGPIGSLLRAPSLYDYSAIVNEPYVYLKFA